MGELGLQAYRFSIAWGRMLPTGRGRVNAAGLDFYDRLVDSLLAAGIRPFPTLYHWDLPAALDEHGGWSNRDSADWFADYAELVFRRLGDRVADWVTLNEPWVMVDAGYVHGVHPPGRSDLAGAPHAAHNLLRAHGNAVRRYRDLERRWRANDRGRIGLVVNLEPKDPASASAADLAAVRRADAYMNRQFLEPVFLGRYPEELAEIYGRHWPDFPADDFALIGERIDFLGLNYYTRAVTRHDPAAPPVCASPVRQPDSVYTDLDWEVHPDSLRDVLGWLRGVLRRSAHLHHRERGGLRRSGAAGRWRRPRAHRRPQPGGLLPRPPARRGRGHRPGRGRARLLRLVAAGQLRVGLRLRQALRHRARGLRHPAAHHQGQRPLLPEGDRDPRRGRPGSRRGARLTMARRGGVLLVAWLCAGLCAAGDPDRPTGYPDPARFAAEVAAFAAADSAAAPPPGAVLCVGSSSMRFWHDTIAEDLAPLTVVPRGFGGSTMFDVLHYAQPLVLACRPRLILLYEGDNDIDFGVAPAEVRAVFDRFVALVRAELPETRIYVISIKPSPARWARWPAMQEANRLLAEACAADSLLGFIDVATPMLGADGRPRPELFLPDMLHLESSRATRCGRRSSDRR